MKRVIRENICTPYSLHDIYIDAIDARENTLVLHLEPGLVRADGRGTQVAGRVEFEQVDWLFCSVWLLATKGEKTRFRGKRMPLADFLKKYPAFRFEVIDEVYGYNQTKYWGNLLVGKKAWECILEIYHAGEMAFVED